MYICFNIYETFYHRHYSYHLKISHNDIMIILNTRSTVIEYRVNIYYSHVQRCHFNT